jgi:hypothetical protein
LERNKCFFEVFDPLLEDFFDPLIDFAAVLQMKQGMNEEFPNEMKYHNPN